MLSQKRLLSSLRYALRHLYDPARLRSSQFARTLEISEQPNAVSTLVDEITRAIESLRPSNELSTASRSWRLYETLFYRYVHQCTQQEVADQLGLSIRQLRREETKALEALTERLVERFGLEIEPSAAGDAESDSGQSGIASWTSSGSPSALDDELRLLPKIPSGDHVHLAAVLPPVMQLVQAMARGHGTMLAVDHPRNAPPLAVSGTVLRQLLLNVLSVAIRQSPGARVALTATLREWEIEVTVQSSGPKREAELESDDIASLEVVRRLAQTCGGDLQVIDARKPFRASIILPALEQVPVLIIDDNADALRLIQRCTAGTRYRAFVARNWEQALAIAHETPPRIVVLDVMMPDVDGWELMGRLQQHPLTNGAPIIVCSILAQEELALSLGADDYLRKPITREGIVNALDRQAHVMGRVPR